MDELVDITTFLTKQNVNKDMQKEILRYYQTIKKKFYIIYLEGYAKNNYYELIPADTPIENIDLTNFYKYIEKELLDINSEYEVQNFAKHYINFYFQISFYDYDIISYDTINIINSLKQNGLYDFNKKLNKFLSNETKEIYLAIKNIEIEI